MINMLKPFKLNTINFSSDIFSPAPQNSMPRTNHCSKRFTYAYRNHLTHPSKQNSFTIDLVHTAALKELDKLQEDAPAAATQQQQKRKNAYQQTYINNFIFQGSKYVKHAQMQHNSRSSCFGHRRNRSESNQHSPKYASETRRNAAERAEQQPQIDTKDEQYKGKSEAVLGKSPQKSDYPSAKFASERKPRSAPKSKRMNSILQSYKVKSIELANPLTPALPYYIDLSNQQNLHELHLQDIQTIQLQRVKYESHRSSSNNHNKKRPLTSKPAPKTDDFQPRPWESQEREEMM